MSTTLLQPPNGSPPAPLARRCRCPRPCVIAAEDDCRCLKCGRRPAFRLGAADQESVS